MPFSYLCIFSSLSCMDIVLRIGGNLPCLVQCWGAFGLGGRMCKLCSVIYPPSLTLSASDGSLSAVSKHTLAVPPSESRISPRMDHLSPLAGHGWLGRQYSTSSMYKRRKSIVRLAAIVYGEYSLSTTHPSDGQYGLLKSGSTLYLIPALTHNYATCFR